eukprot:1160423-Pelagomonas_calceolata.AAC.4
MLDVRRVHPQFDSVVLFPRFVARRGLARGGKGLASGGSTEGVWQDKQEASTEVYCDTVGTGGTLFRCSRDSGMVAVGSVGAAVEVLLEAIREGCLCSDSLELHFCSGPKGVSFRSKWML